MVLSLTVSCQNVKSSVKALACGWSISMRKRIRWPWWWLNLVNVHVSSIDVSSSLCLSLSGAFLSILCLSMYHSHFTCFLPYSTSKGTISVPTTLPHQIPEISWVRDITTARAICLLLVGAVQGLAGSMPHFQRSCNCHPATVGELVEYLAFEQTGSPPIFIEEVK